MRRREDGIHREKFSRGEAQNGETRVFLGRRQRGSSGGHAPTPLHLAPPSSTRLVPRLHREVYPGGPSCARRFASAPSCRLRSPKADPSSRCAHPSKTCSACSANSTTMEPRVHT